MIIDQKEVELWENEIHWMGDKHYIKKWYLRWSCRFPRGTKLGENARQGLVLAAITPLSPRAGAAVSKVGGKWVTLSRKDRERGLSCTAARVLKFNIQGSIRHSKVVLTFLRPRTCAALSGMRGLSCTELCAVAPRK
jgi:hypothetical protein